MGATLPLMEMFTSLQGEGYHTGKAALFIRLAGCDIGCNWCDSKASWNIHNGTMTPVEEILRQAAASGLRSAVITGGEPLTCNLDKLCSGLKALGFILYLETSGSHHLTGDWDWICLSPKKNTPPLDAIFHEADELKVIIENPSDLGWAEQNATKVSTACLLYLQPEWSKREAVTPVIVQHILKNPRWAMSLQSHKYIGIP